MEKRSNVIGREHLAATASVIVEEVRDFPRWIAQFTSSPFCQTAEQSK
jgi:hypothetical protein